MCPRASPDQVITIRFELQETERRIIEQAIAAYSVNAVSDPIVEILKDASALYAVVTMIELFTDIDLPILTPADTDEIWSAIRDAWTTRREAFPDDPRAGSLAMIVKDWLVRFFGFSTSSGGGGEF